MLKRISKQFYFFAENTLISQINFEFSPKKYIDFKLSRLGDDFFIINDFMQTSKEMMVKFYVPKNPVTHSGFTSLPKVLRCNHDQQTEITGWTIRDKITQNNCHYLPVSRRSRPSQAGREPVGYFFRNLFATLISILQVYWTWNPIILSSEKFVLNKDT